MTSSFTTDNQITPRQESCLSEALASRQTILVHKDPYVSREEQIRAFLRDLHNEIPGFCFVKIPVT